MRGREGRERVRVRGREGRERGETEGETEGERETRREKEISQMKEIILRSGIPHDRCIQTCYDVHDIYIYICTRHRDMFKSNIASCLKREWYNSCLLSAMTYGADISCTLNKQSQNKLAAAQPKLEINMLNITVTLLTEG